MSRDGTVRGALGVATPPARALEPETAAAHRSVIASHHGHRDFVIRRLLALADAIAVTMALLVATAVNGGPRTNFELLAWGVLSVPAWTVLFKIYGLYERDAKRVSHATLDDLPWIFHSVVIGTLLMWLYLKAVAKPLPMVPVAVFGATAIAALLSLRSFVRRMSVQVLGADRVLLVGEERMTRVLVRKMRAHPEYGLEPIGMVCPSGGTTGKLDVPVLGELDDVPGVVSRHGVDRVVLSQTVLGETEALDIMRRCKEQAVKVSVLPQVFDALGPSVEIDDVEGVTLLGINPPVLSRSSRYMKRCLDFAGAIAMLILLSPLIILIALAVKRDSPGPVLFRQRRVGKGGSRFEVMKFRTMHTDAEARRADLISESKDPNWLHLDDDPRITRVGRLLRHTSLDEVPQLWNVLKGDMSLVGPRPLIESEDRQVGGWGRTRLDLTPGLTGVWQVLGRTSIPFDEMVKLDYLYVTNWSLWTDVRLIIRTLPAVLTRRGVN
jgi:exopolysaccharide biosynthesis polyprenyl glycosylphosphotransferase